MSIDPRERFNESTNEFELMMKLQKITNIYNKQVKQVEILMNCLKKIGDFCIKTPASFDKEFIRKLIIDELEKVHSVK